MASKLRSEQSMDLNVGDISGLSQDDSKEKVQDTSEKSRKTVAAKKSQCRKKHSCNGKEKHRKKSRKSKPRKDESEDSSDSDSDSSDSSISSEDEARKRRKRAKSRRVRTASSKKRYVSSSESESSDDESEEPTSESESESEEEVKTRRKRKDKKTKSKKTEIHVSTTSHTQQSDSEDTDSAIAVQIQQVAAQLKLLHDMNRERLSGRRRRGGVSRRNIVTEESDPPVSSPADDPPKDELPEKKAKRGSKLDFKRIDYVWDRNNYTWKRKESAEDAEDEFDEYVFTVTRRFDYENEYKATTVEIKSTPLRDALAEVMKDVKAVSLVEDQPCLDPNMLFHYIEEIRHFIKKTLKSRINKAKRKKAIKKLEVQKKHCKILLEYLDADYENTKKTLYPMIEAGNISFDLLWALFKPTDIAYTTTYGSTDEPRAFKIFNGSKECSFMRGTWFSVQGSYLEYDGKHYGMGDMVVDIDHFKGPRKITSLAVYPLKYHPDAKAVEKKLVERGRRFVSFEGMNYKFHKGLAFMKKKRTVLKVNTNSRIMIDPATFRRVNPNYPISWVENKPEEYDDDSDDSAGCCGGDGCDSDQENDEPKVRRRVVFDKKNKPHLIEVPVDSDGEEAHIENLEKLDKTSSSKKQTFTDEELLIASPVVLGFAFSEKLWLEFSISGVGEIDWNDQAFDSLVLPGSHKSVVRALVESHKHNSDKTIDDVIQGKGKGLVAVLHGSPGTGKTLTAEGIAELLRCPLYMVSVGELGTDIRVLEQKLQEILDIAHGWGAVLLLDEADVFLEKRQVQDVHRNAMVSIFLRLLEYFQGILFLTTNRVETFDEAFQSRIHVALRYGELTTKVKKEIWKTFLEKVGEMEGDKRTIFKDHDYTDLAKHTMNGRQIKNTVRTAQAMALHEDKVMTMEHIRKVIEVAESFDRDIKGGSGYEDAMRSYT